MALTIIFVAFTIGSSLAFPSGSVPIEPEEYHSSRQLMQDLDDQYFPWLADERSWAENYKELGLYNSIIYSRQFGLFEDYVSDKWEQYEGIITTPIFAFMDKHLAFKQILWKHCSYCILDSNRMWNGIQYVPLRFS